MAQLPFNAALRSVAAHPQSKNSSDHKEVNLSLAQARALGGNCFGADIYSVRWPVKSIAEPFRDLMESQVVIELAGGIAEACHRGERRRRAILAFAESHCAIDAKIIKHRFDHER